MDPSPPRPAFQLAILLLISLELLAVVIGNDVLLVAVLVLIVIVAYFWIRFTRSHSLKTKYSPENATPKEDWRGKSDKDNNPL